MKNLLFALMTIFVFSFLQSCMEDEGTSPNGSVPVQFFFPLDARSAPDLPDASVNVSLENADGQIVLMDHPLSFTLSNGTATTEPLMLPPGDYKLTNLTREAGGKSMDLLYDINTGTDGVAPLNFSIDAHRKGTVRVNCMKAQKGKFQLGVYAEQKGKKALTSATAYIIQNGTVLRTYQLTAKLNKTTFDLSPTTTYQLVIVKQGYARLTQDFVYKNLGNKPLKLTLTEGMTMRAIPSVGLNNLFSFVLEATAGTVYVDWGDGTSESRTFTPADNFFDFSKEYATSNPYYVTLTGDVDLITYFYSFYGNGTMSEADFYALTGLKELRFGPTEGPPIIDLRNNSNLEKLLMPGLSNMEQLLLPTNHNIHDINIAGSNMMSTAAVDAVIANIYNNAIANSISNGVFGLSIDWGDAETDVFIGPPSATGFAQLTYLRDTLGWEIVPVF